MWPASDSDRRTPEAPVLAYFWGNLECPASEYNRGTPETRERESSLFKYFFLPKHTNEILVYFQIIRIFFNLSDADRESVEKDPELQSAIRWQVDLETQYADRSQNPALRAMLEDQKRQVHNLRRRLQDKRRKETRRDFSRKQAVIDIERQLTVGAVSDEPAREVLRKGFEMPSEQILLVETFFTWPTTDSLEDE